MLSIGYKGLNVLVTSQENIFKMITLISKKCV